MPGGKSNIKGTDGNTFSSTNQPANRGRKPKVFTQLSKDWQARGIERATSHAIAEAFEYLLALPLTEVKEIAGRADDEANDMPMAVRLAAKELLGRRALDIFKEMLDRSHGKPRQAIEHSGKDGAEIQVKKTVIWELPPEPETKPE